MTPQKIALLTDSCADLSPQMAEENQIYVVPLRILCADGEYRDSVDIHAADIYARLRSGELPQTSLPAAQDITGAFDRIAADGYDAVIALMLSGGLSGTYNMVRLLAEERTDLTIRVYDSVSGSLGTGMMVLQLAEDIRLGMDWDTLTERRVPWLIRNTFPFFSVDTLEYLQKGGRIGKVTAMAGTMLNIKPLITFAADGQLQSIAKVRGRRAVQDKLIELVRKSLGTTSGTTWPWPTAARRRRWPSSGPGWSSSSPTTTTSGRGRWTPPSASTSATALWAPASRCWTEAAK